MHLNGAVSIERKYCGSGGVDVLVKSAVELFMIFDSLVSDEFTGIFLSRIQLLSIIIN